MDEKSVFCQILSNITEEIPEMGTALEDNDFTIFVPTDAAFAESEELLMQLDDVEVTDIVTFHFYEGKQLTYDELLCQEKLTMMIHSSTHPSRTDSLLSRTRCEGDVKYQKGNGNTKHGSLPVISPTKETMACNAIIHSIDHLMYPAHLKEMGDPLEVETSKDDSDDNVQERAASNDDNCTSVVDTICGMDEKSVFCQILSNITEEMPDLGTALEDNEFTIFVPTDTAFAESEELLEQLDDFETTRIVAFHFYEGKQLTFDELACQEKLTMMSDFSTDLSRTRCVKGVKYQKGNGNTKHGSLPEISPSKETMACNAIIHSIDHLMFPVHLNEMGEPVETSKDDADDYSDDSVGEEDDSA